MPDGTSPLEDLRTRLKANETEPVAVMIEAQSKADAGAGERPVGGTYMQRDAAAALRYAVELPGRFPEAAIRPPLYGVPVSIKDCFDIAGTVTSCGSRFYAGWNRLAIEDAWIVRRLLDAGAMVTGKTHLHQLAYGITGENADYGDSLQPRDRSLLTGGSSSGACASVQEGSAMVAVGTDTGGSIRVPAALCGLAGYRASHGLFPEEVCWKGGAHLAKSFDTLGLIFRDLRDGPVLGHAIFGLPFAQAAKNITIGCVGDEFLHDCDADVMAAYDAQMQRMIERGATLKVIDTESWDGKKDIFMAIQASEAATLHRGHFSQFEKAISERLAWGASISAEELAALHLRLRQFQSSMAALLEQYDFLMLPCAPVSRLLADQDQSGARARILRYTVPISMAGAPTVTLPGERLGDYFGTGVQLVAGKGKDAELLAFAAGA